MAELLQLRPLQMAVIDALHCAFREHKNILIQAPCGFGKTELATAILKAVKANYKTGAFLMDRISLVNQASERFDKYGLDHGIIQGQNERTEKNNPIQIVSQQTLKEKPLKVSLLVVDECHVLPTALKNRLAKRECYSIGLTATPFTKGLGQYFDHVINAATTNELIARGDLVPFRVFAASEPNMEGAKVKNTGEWRDEDVESRVLPIIGDAVLGYQQHGQGKKFIAFASSVSHAEEMQRQFMAAGVICSLCTYRQSDDEKDAAVAEFRKKDSYIRGLISIESLTRGFDVPDIEVLILARPLRKALAVHIQMLGRVLRCATGKSEAIVLDHSGNCMRFWSEVDDFFENGISELDDGKPKAAKPAAKKESKPVKCPTCFHLHKAMPSCPCCGHTYSRAKEVLRVEGQLQEVKKGKKPVPTDEQKREFFAGLRYIAEKKGWQPGWAAYKFKEKYGDFPSNVMKLTPAREPGPEVLGWIQNRIIAHRHSKKAASV